MNQKKRMDRPLCLMEVDETIEVVDIEKEQEDAEH